MQGSCSVPDHTWRGLSTARTESHSWRSQVSSSSPPAHSGPERDSPSAEETNFRTIYCRPRVTWGVTVGPRDTAVPSHSPLSTAGHIAVLEEMEEDKKGKGEGELPKSNPSIDKTNTWTSCKSCMKSKQQTFQEQVKCDPKYSITKSQNATFPWEA